MKRYKIEFDREKCIGAALCVTAAPDNWKINDDGKADVKNIDIGEREFTKNLQAARNCPVNAIHIIDTKTKKRII